MFSWIVLKLFPIDRLNNRQKVESGWHLLPNHIFKYLQIMVHLSEYSKYTYTVSRKKGATDFFAVTFTNIDGFS